MEKDTRSLLQSVTQRARALLTEDIYEQLQGTYDVMPDGAIAPEPGIHLNERQRLLRPRIVAAIQHKQAAGMKPVDAVKDYVRDAAFTTFNRYAALKLLEARNLVLECVTRGDQSSGYLEFTGLLPGIRLLPDGEGYRLYLESVFDELSTEVKVLFDRRDPASALWPKRATFETLLDILNAPELASVWFEDETIGWVYQYFNSTDERRKMRDESQAPRNSRELAIRNQFFTPRYVVEFLVDNTLGRLWFNWTGGQTNLRDRCQYLLAKPDEKPEPTGSLRDPRTIKLLDPACGSMHFGLYAFDLFHEIYREAWDWEQTHGAGSLDKVTRGEASLKPLTETYADIDAFLRDVPRMIIQYNIYGVDIDPRAAQIASLALWLRAQRAWHDADVNAQHRPQIGRGQVMAAAAPPVEADLRKRFMADLDPLDAYLFEQTLFMLKGLPELGVLLQVEKELPALIRKAFGGHGDLFRTHDMALWEKAENRLRVALKAFGHAAQSSYQGRLFAEDALQGLRIMDISPMAFDVIVMNPPFGLPSPAAREYIDEHYFGAHGDIYASFVARAIELAPNGFVGCITSSSFLLSPRMEEFRKKLLPRINCIADFGLGVMDDAMVRSAVYILGSSKSSEFLTANVKPHINSIKGNISPNALISLFDSVEKQTFIEMPQSRFLIDAPSSVRNVLVKGPYFEPDGGTAREGMKTFDNERFIRLPWELNGQDIGKNKKWRWLVKGGEFALFYSEIHLLLNWSNDGEELKQINFSLNGSTSQVRQASTFWGQEGATYSKRASGFSARVLPKDCIFTSNGPAIIPLNGTDPLYLIGWLNSRPIRAFAHLNAGAYDSYSTGALKQLPWKKPGPAQTENMRNAVASAIYASKRQASLSEECSGWFVKMPLYPKLSIIKTELNSLIVEKDNQAKFALATADAVVSELYDFQTLDWTSAFIGDALDHNESSASNSLTYGESPDQILLSDAEVAYRTISYLVGIAFGRWTPSPEINTEITEALEDAVAALPSILPGANPFALSAGFDGSILSTGSLTELVRTKLNLLVGPDNELESECLIALSAKTLEIYLDNPNMFFKEHISNYSKSKRSAPIYWQLGVPSGRYGVWIYAPKAIKDTLFRLQDDILEQKIANEQRALAEMSTGRQDLSVNERKNVEEQEVFVAELRQFSDEVKRVAPLWNPHLDDGIIITMAPLWRMVGHYKPLQKELRAKWQDLQAGQYDWSHQAMHLWPERVVPKCAEDRSLAIAHGLEDVFWFEPESGKWAKRDVPTRPVAEIVRERTSDAVKAALKELLEAPEPAAAGGRSRRKA
ncbi:BREX-1 system adenine-specific DNA-methyltransferase PglX [Bosea sp. (in: a-proteobacteria)]